ncbi:DUF1798 family protein [Staphylococcus simulans]|uniref:DUF1798 family protein n=1 Tax=Staphylococcus simulans TaxID=1286 RepID=UPI000CD28F5C|nr:DUF1798 family protein [Staphylococcus simulans]MCE5024429.1 DUF1798 family protein [Staphylococcus simulans]PNZ45945.1 DUF1798 domain-containing protein [Staphylococcus simulans]PTJ00174.1 DUF1798 domain-containing protein [Staphylococcus simulans]PTJ06766.1 DUF1798 domain-containing protein [Staphylococcus simulans]PTJ12818.1 DUF1798 domain-containing protein [Staphylococcus simulans]
MYTIISTLIEQTYIMKQRYEEARSGKAYDFKNEVMPFAYHIDDLLNHLDGYAENIIALSYMNQLKYQILKENLERLSVECHYASASRKLFMDKLKSVNYDLNYLKESETQYG